MSRTETGATPLMVAAKYLSRPAIETLLRDPRVELGAVDGAGR